MSSLSFYSSKEQQILMTNKKIRGIYKIVKKINNNVYIGSSVNIESRHQGHKKDLRNGKHHNYLF
ncbi:GIY-YIG nuclease family protein [Bacillus subtilis]|uniref:GIY-YIG nuclease family protein n=1 Tax=Bacillus subtilis TaxID=1423 RepID=UPI0033421BCA